MRQFGDGVGRGRSDDQQIGFLPQLHVRHMRIVPPQIGVRQRRSSGYGGNITGPTNFVADSVRITSTSAPACVNLLARSAILYAAIPPQTPSTVFLFWKRGIDSMWIDSCGVIPSEARNLYDCQRKMLLMTEISRDCAPRNDTANRYLDNLGALIIVCRMCPSAFSG